MPNVSHMVKAMRGWESQGLTSSSPPGGMFGQRVTIQTSRGVTVKNTELDCEFSVPFDEGTEENEAEVVIYNLSKSTLAKLRYNDTLTITAGYAGDTGIILSGRIIKVTSKWDGVDRKTTLTILDTTDLEERNIGTITYLAGTTYVYILKDLIKRSGLPVAIFEIKTNGGSANFTTVDGSIMANIKTCAQACGVSAFVHNGKWYVCDIKKAKLLTLALSVDTGLLDSPEPFEEEDTTGNSTKVNTGYKIKTLLHHRAVVGATVTLKSRDANGTFTIRSGKHTFDGTNLLTEMEVIA